MFSGTQEKFEQWIQSAKSKSKEAIQRTKVWLKDNKEVLIVLSPVIIGGFITICKVVGKRSNLQKEESIKNLYCYDRSLGHYWKLRRDLSTREWIMVDRRRQSGERLVDILEDLNVLM